MTSRRKTTRKKSLRDLQVGLGVEKVWPSARCMPDFAPAAGPHSNMVIGAGQSELDLRLDCDGKRRFDKVNKASEHHSASCRGPTAAISIRGDGQTTRVITEDDSMRRGPQLSLQCGSNALSMGSSQPTPAEQHYTSMQELLSKSGFSETRIVSPMVPNHGAPLHSPVLEALQRDSQERAAPTSPSLSHKASFTERLFGNLWKPNDVTVPSADKPIVTQPQHHRSHTLSTQSVVSASTQDADAYFNTRPQSMSVDDEAPELTFDEDADTTANFARFRALQWVNSASGSPSLDRVAQFSPGNATIPALDYFSIITTLPSIPIKTTPTDNQPVQSPTESIAARSLRHTLRQAKSVPALKEASTAFERDGLASPQESIFSLSSISQSTVGSNRSGQRPKTLRKTASHAVLRPAVALSPLLTLDHNIDTPQLRRTAFTDKTNIKTNVVKMPSPERDPHSTPKGQRKSVFAIVPDADYTPIKTKRSQDTAFVRDLAELETEQGGNSIEKGGSLARLFSKKQRKPSPRASDSLRGVLETAKVLPFPVGIVPPKGIARVPKLQPTTPLIVVDAPR